MKRLCAALILAALCLSGPQAAHASGHHAKTPEPQGLHSATHWMLGFKLGVFVERSGKGAWVPFEGGELSVEWEWHPHMALELAAGFFGGEGTLAFPVELLFKVPFHPNERVTPFVGAGPLALFSFHPGADHHGTSGVYFGAVVSMGSVFWWGEHWGVELAVRGEMLESPIHPSPIPQLAVGLQSGIVYRS